MSTNITVSAKEALTFSSTKRTLYANLATLVQYLQMEYGGGWQENTIKSLVLPGTLMSLAEKSDNPDLLSDSDISATLNQVIIIDGIPTISDLPVWDRFSGEPLTYYNVFRRYLMLKEETGSRFIGKVAEGCGISPRDLMLISKAYHWQYRVIPYDRHVAELKAIRRQREAESLDTSLGKTARNLIEVASIYIDDHIEQLSPKLAIDLLKTMVPIARIAVGLPGTAPAEEMKIGAGLRAGKTDVNVNINNAVGENANASSIHGLTESEVIDKMKTQNDDPTTLASIANVLIQSGAIESTILNETDAIDAIDTDFVEGE